MKNLLFLFVVMMMTPFNSMTPKKEDVRCQKQKTQFTLDGRVDIGQNNWSFDNKRNVYYRLSNDEKNLYVQLMFQNPSDVRKITAFGFKLSIDPNAKGRNELSIHYPLGNFHKGRQAENGSRTNNLNRDYRNNRTHMNPNMMNPDQRQEMMKERAQRINQMFLINRDKAELQGFDKNKLNDAFFGEGDINALVQINEKGALIYEAVIPLKSIFNNSKRYFQNQTPFSIIFETGYLEQDMTHIHHGSGAMGGRMGGGSPAGMQRNASAGSFQEMLVPTKIKLKKVLLNND